ncbi:MAG: hypothetical protein SPI14_00775 [Arcanobacterium sp.]|nr:hypothetical protein [Arcanobacterium sp.]
MQYVFKDGELLTAQSLNTAFGALETSIGYVSDSVHFETLYYDSTGDIWEPVDKSKCSWINVHRNGEIVIVNGYYDAGVAGAYSQRGVAQMPHKPQQVVFVPAVALTSNVGVAIGTCYLDSNGLIVLSKPASGSGLAFQFAYNIAGEVDKQ